jgi:hypothetical protein
MCHDSDGRVLGQPGRLDEERMPDRRKNLEQVIKLFDTASADPRLTRLIDMRNKLIAHMARYDQTVFTRPTYDDLFGFARLEHVRRWMNRL